jgi:peroxiredoxin
MRARLLMILLLSCWYFLGPAAGSLHEWIGTPAPDFSLKTLSGKATISLHDYKGKIVLLDFWASWCAPCQRSLPELQTLEEQYENLKILAISIDDKEENAREFMKRQQLDLTVLFDEKKFVAETYDIEDMPSALLIDQDGVIRFVLSGYTEKHLPELKREIDKLILEDLLE